eukprot:TRINITY_DN44405_c0_g1_i1.p1 TRINITY_DN44405_c0_g1~~TRINITY_DN44405_c0_g1_i1.p1  ORF type:complete len:356 (-),score=39.26 TRINITY_DN44405_c0_g1_i1:114-1181(-)
MDNAAGAVLFRRRSAAQGADVVFEVGEDGATEDVWAHSIVLTAVSPVMEALFTGTFREAHERRVRISDVTPRVFFAFLEILYTGTSDFRCGLVVPDFYNSSRRTPRHVAVRVSNPPATLSEWKEMLMRAGVRKQISKSGCLYTTCKKSTGRVKESWLTCMNAKTAREVVRKLGLTERQATIVGEPHCIEVLEVVMLLDRYAVEGFAEWAKKALAKYIDWGSDSLTDLLSKAFCLGAGSAYRREILKACRDALCDDDCHGKFVKHFRMHVTRAPPAGLTIDTARLQARLQLLRWANDMIKMRTDPENTYSLMVLMSRGMQEVVDGLSGQVPDPDSSSSSEEGRRDGETRGNLQNSI